MPAPEDLTVQTPGEALTPAANDAAATTTTDTADDPAKPAFTVKHNGGGRYIVLDAKGDKVGDFTGDKTSAEAEAERLIAGGEPYTAVTAPAKPAAEAKPTAKASGAVDPTTLKQPVMTADGWLCPEPKLEA
jgi:hypothetical protein